MTWLYLLNRVLLQWLFLRLARVVENDGTQVGWTVLLWPYPETGWSGPYKFVGGRPRSRSPKR